MNFQDKTQEADEYRWKEEGVIGGVKKQIMEEGNRHSIALLLDGRDQALEEVHIHSCTLESLDHVYSFSHIGAERKKHQDRVLIYPRQSLIFLGDGYGFYGDLIADAVADYVLAHPKKSFTNIATEAQIILTEVSPHLPQLYGNEGKKLPKGGTACGLLRIEKNAEKKKILRSFRIGDVNIAVIRRGLVPFRTKDQTEGQYCRDLGMPEVLCKEKDHHLINSISADTPHIEYIEEEPFELERGDCVIIGCDGVMKGLNNEALTRGFLGYTPRQFTEWLVKMGQDVEHPDNITASVIDIT